MYPRFRVESPLARCFVQASIQGAGTVEGRCSGDRIEAAAVAGFHKLLAAYLMDWIRAVRCAPCCDGRAVRFQVSFVLRAEIAGPTTGRYMNSRSPVRI